ncbi:PHP domain-containing protein [Natronospora cellulosivora (SeqCode)]
MLFIGDYHTHSEYSHGKGKLRLNIEKAIQRDLKELAITDHGPATWNFIKLGVKKVEELLEIKDKVYTLQSEYPQIKLYSGVEANIIDTEGNLDVPEKILRALDIVAVGFHLLIIPDSLLAAKKIILDNRYIYKYIKRKREEIRKSNTEIIIKSVKKNRPNFITHPGYKIDIDTYNLANVCAKSGTYLEINTRHGMKTKDYIREAAKSDVRFIVNSDAHSPKEVGELDLGYKLISDLDISHDRIVNIVKK